MFRNSEVYFWSTIINESAIYFDIHLRLWWKVFHLNFADFVQTSFAQFFCRAWAKARCNMDSGVLRALAAVNCYFPTVVFTVRLWNGWKLRTTWDFFFIKQNYNIVSLLTVRNSVVNRTLVSGQSQEDFLSKLQAWEIANYNNRNETRSRLIWLKWPQKCTKNSKEVAKRL